jgi:hypothetical protein
MCGEPTKGGPPAWALGEVLTNPHRKSILLRNVYKNLGPGLILWYDLSKGKGQRLGTWNVRSLFRPSSLTVAARELARYKLDLVGVQEVRCEKRGKVKQGIIIFSMEKEAKIVN